MDASCADSLEVKAVSQAATSKEPLNKATDSRRHISQGLPEQALTLHPKQDNPMESRYPSDTSAYLLEVHIFQKRGPEAGSKTMKSSLSTEVYEHKIMSSELWP